MKDMIPKLILRYGKAQGLKTLLYFVNLRALMSNL